MFYQLAYENYNRTKSIIKIILLTIAVVIDFFNIYNIVRLCLGDLIALAYIFIFILISSLIRAFAISLCYKYKIQYRDGMIEIIKILPLKRKRLLFSKTSDLTIKKYDLHPKTHKKVKNTLIIIDNNPTLAYYSIEIKTNEDNKKIILPLDNYMYYLIVTNEGKNNVIF